MSKLTKQKYVAKEVLDEVNGLEERQRIVKIVAGRGNNLHQVRAENGDTFLASMPVKFRRNVWIKRGDYVVVEPIEEGDKVKAEITKILYKDQIRQLKKDNLWPSQFDDENKSEEHSVNNMKTEEFEDECESEEDESESGDDDSESKDDELFVNTNH